MKLIGCTLLVAVLLAPGNLLAQASPPALSQGSGTEFVVRPGDVLKIRVWPDEQLGGEYPVEENGFVYLPVLGGVEAGGMTLSNLRAELRSLYGEALRSPAVSVTPLFSIPVLGAVQRPGLYHIEPTNTIFDAISMAGGFRPDARTDQVRLVRAGEVIEMDAERTIEEGGDALSLSLQSGDRLIVPERWRWNIRDVMWGLQSVALLITLIGRF